MRNRLKAIQDRCARACEKAGRDPKSVRLVAVSKGHQAEKILEAYSLGLREFGENYAVELASKMKLLEKQCPEIHWHYIGHIQSNKLKLIAPAQWIHGLSETRHAQLLKESASQVLLQVNLGGEGNRSGVSEKDVLNRYAEIHGVLGDRLRGLMTIAPQHSGVEPLFWFSKMAELRSELELKLGVPVPELSMGMSGDFEDAILMGATWIRIGTLLFGERTT